MKKLICLMLIASMSIPFTGCSDAKAAYAFDAPKLVEVANEKKAETTPAPKADTTNSAVKGITVNEKGELVTTYANGVIQTIKGLAGEKGPKGDKGDKGAKGDPGRDGIDGKDGKDGRDGSDGSDGRDGSDGVGISSVTINDNGELIVTLTNGTTSNAGNIVDMVANRVNGQPNIPGNQDYEKVGYKLKNNLNFPMESEHGAYLSYSPNVKVTDNAYNRINSVEVELIEVNDQNPSKKYKYRATMEAISYWDFTSYETPIFVSNPTNPDHGTYYTITKGGFIVPSVRLDNTLTIFSANSIDSTNTETPQQITYEFDSSTPYVSITGIGAVNKVVAYSTTPTADYEKVGYKVKNNISFPIKSNTGVLNGMEKKNVSPNGYVQINSIDVELVNVDATNSSGKYKYLLTANVIAFSDISTFPFIINDYVRWENELGTLTINSIYPGFGRVIFDNYNIVSLNYYKTDYSNRTSSEPFDMSIEIYTNSLFKEITSFQKSSDIPNSVFGMCSDGTFTAY